MLQAIQAATSADNLRARMQSLQGPTLTSADRALPLLQQQWTLISNGLRLALSSLAFAAGAQRRLSVEPLLMERSRAFGRWSPSSTG